MHRPLLLALLVAALLAGCQATLPQHRVHQRVLEQPQLLSRTDRVLLLPIDIEIKEMSTSGLTEVVPAWTETARELLRQELLAQAAPRLGARVLQPMPETSDLQPDEHMEEYMRLAKLVWANAFFMTQLGGPAWRHKAKRFDYSLGPGLKTLAERSGAHRALLVIGEDVHSTAGRKALMVGMAALGVVVPLGHTFLSVSLIDLDSGDLLWMNTFIRGDNTSLLKAEDIRKVLDDLFADYPGIEPYRRFAERK